MQKIMHACNLSFELKENQYRRVSESYMTFMNAFEVFICIGETFGKQWKSNINT